MAAKKLRSRRAMTLTEVLVAVAILSLVTLGVAAGVSSSLRVYRQSVALSDAQTLSATLSAAMMDELRYARDIKQGDPPTFTSASYGGGAAFTADSEGRLMLGQNKPLVGSGTYAGLKAALDELTYSEEDGFSVKLSIADSAGEAIQTVEFSVMPLNS